MTRSARSGAPPARPSAHGAAHALVNADVRALAPAFVHEPRLAPWCSCAFADIKSELRTGSRPAGLDDCSPHSLAWPCIRVPRTREVCLIGNYAMCSSSRCDFVGRARCVSRGFCASTSCRAEYLTMHRHARLLSGRRLTALSLLTWCTYQIGQADCNWPLPCGSLHSIVFGVPFTVHCAVHCAVALLLGRCRFKRLLAWVYQCIPSEGGRTSGCSDILTCYKNTGFQAGMRVVDHATRSTGRAAQRGQLSLGMPPH